MMKKTLAFGIVLLFIGVAFAPSLYADVETVSEQQGLVEIPIQICGLGGIKEHTAKLSEVDADRLDTLFVDIHRRLNASESREETISIYKDAVVELDNLGLLGGYSVEEVQKLVTGEIYRNPLVKKQTSMLNIDDNKATEIYYNSDCFVSGEFDNSGLIDGITFYISILAPFVLYAIIKLLELFEDFNSNQLNLLSNSYSDYKEVLSFKNFFSLFGYVTVGGSVYNDDDYSTVYTPSVGWIRTEGTYGLKEWNGSFLGDIFEVTQGGIITWWTTYFGIREFTGFKIGNHVFGYAQGVQLRRFPEY